MESIFHTLEPQILDDLTRKMVFLSGPRQVGKTTLAKKIVSKLQGRYLLYDNTEDREIILNRPFTDTAMSMVCLDEFHKFKRWKDYLKGVYDKHKETLSILVTGSARLDIYQQSGDSLFGRFYLHYLHPLSLAELHQVPIQLPQTLQEPHKPLDGLDELIRFSGFPEPFLAAQDSELRRWSNQRRELLMREDLAQLTQIQLLGVAEQVMLLIPKRIGAPFSYSSLAQDIQVATQTIQKWLYNFERLFIVFKLLPYTQNIARSLQKRPKYYLWNWTDIPDPGIRFENVIASHLLKATQTWTALGLANTQLHYIQDRAAHEVDFLVTKDNEPWFLVETKLSDTNISKNLMQFSKKLNVPGIQLVNQTGIYRQSESVTVISANQWLGHLL